MPDLRLFAAVYPPAEIARALVEALAALELPDHRLVGLEQVHLTLHFIGDTPPQKLDAAIEALRRSTAGLRSFELSPCRLITLPRRPPARLVAAETDRAGALLEIQRRLAGRFARKPRRNPGDRFRPHLTLCRFRTPTRAAVDEPLTIPSFCVVRVVLMQSTLSSEGAHHQEVASAPLTG